MPTDLQVDFSLARAALRQGDKLNSWLNHTRSFCHLGCNLGQVHSSFNIKLSQGGRGLYRFVDQLKLFYYRLGTLSCVKLLADSAVVA